MVAAVWRLDSEAPVPLWRHDVSPESPGVLMAFSTRQGGVSQPPFDTLNLGRSTADDPDAVDENRARLLRSIGFSPSRVVTLGQIHGARVVTADAPGLQPECDAAATRTPGLALAVTGADCLPLLFVAGDAVAVAHAGWRGILAGVAEAALQAVCSAGMVPPAEADAHLGPCIRACCYEVGEEVAERFPSEAMSRHAHSVHLDLPAAVRLRLMSAGLPLERIEDTGACTACDPSRYFSHRRDRGSTGRHWGVIGWRGAPA
jgi:purine-nucleoside/S-methyl-5'-thioadenosine phosphorylase / adenosine deaminase